jgi:indole-3-glycerol phosphate synthase
MFLEHIITQTRADLAQRKQELPLEEVQCLAAAQSGPRDLLVALRHVKSDAVILSPSLCHPERSEGSNSLRVNSAKDLCVRRARPTARA